MAIIKTKSAYLLRRDTAENWKTKNPILRKGEEAYETDTGKRKVGDGITEWNGLGYDINYSYTNNTFSNALKGKLSGSSVFIDDVSPVTHDMTVKISSDIVTDLTSIKVKTCGKNLIDFFNISAQQSITFTNSYGNLSTKTGYLLEKLETGEKYTISFSFNDDSSICKYLYLYDVDENWVQQSITYLTAESIYTNPHTFTVTEGHHYFIIRGATYTITQSEIDKFKEFQVENGSTATEYEAYITPTEYTPNAYGTVDNMAIIYPNMTIYTDTDGITIDCEYNRDINKAFAELQQAIISLGGSV